MDAGLWNRISRVPETWPEMERAAQERFWDGAALACEDQRETGAIYAWGYVAEMLLKSAAMSMRGVSPGADIGPILRAAGTRHHRLADLLEDLRTLRSAMLKPLDADLDEALGVRIRVLAANWNSRLRYRAARATSQELHDVYEAVEWLIRHYDAIR